MLNVLDIQQTSRFVQELDSGEGLSDEMRQWWINRY